MKRIAVIGGGAAGMMAAYAAASAGANVVLLEKNEKLGKKLYITGKGRCNLTNACDTENFFANIPTNPKFLYSAIYSFTNSDLIALMEKNGCETKIERGGRVFPKSDKSSDVIKTLRLLLQKTGVEIRCGTAADGIIIEDGAAKGVIIGGKKQRFDAVIVATGGVSYPLTGSTGDGYVMAKKAGHTLREPRASLVALIAGEKELCADLAGLSLVNVKLTLTELGRQKYCEQGELLFTHKGISGPLVLSASAHISDYGFADTAAQIDLKPALDRETLDRRILRDFGEAKNRQIKHALEKLFPKKLIGWVLLQAQIDAGKAVNEITREERVRLIEATKALRLKITGTGGFEEAIITRGGVNVKEIDPATLESRLVKGLYFAGEMIDVDAYTGGFNLQIAFSTGRLAGESAAAAE